MAVVPGSGGGDGALDSSIHPLLLFSVCKHELYTPTQGFKHLVRRLRGQFQIRLVKELSLGVCKEATAIVFGCPRESFTNVELSDLRAYINEGGCLLFLNREGGDTMQGTNANSFIQDYGITVNSNCLVRTTQKKYLHPKEVLISDTALCKDLKQFSIGKPLKQKDVHTSHTSVDFHTTSFEIVYPYGATLVVQSPSIPILSSGLHSYPCHQPIGAIWESERDRGRIAVLGSGAIFDDNWLDKEDNSKLCDFLFMWLSQRISLKKIDVEQLEIVELEHVPDIRSLANRLHCCLQEVDNLPRDVTKLMDDSLFQYHTDLIPDVLSLYERLGIKHAPLSLIAPQCKGVDQEDLAFYILEAASFFGITPKIIGDSSDNYKENAKAVLGSILEDIINMKKAKSRI